MPQNSLTHKTVGLKIDVDTERGTRIGVPNLLCLFEKYGVKATFYFSLGPDNTGRAIRRIFKPGFFKKVSRTSVLEIYGLRTLLNGVLLKGPHIGKKHADLMQQTASRGHETGIHCYDHTLWQDFLHTWPKERILEEVNKAVAEYVPIFGVKPHTMAAAGWQASFDSLAAYDAQSLLYASDTRGTVPFYPTDGCKNYKTLQLPSTLPTLDELIGRPEFPFENITQHYFEQILRNELNIFTLHSELEGMRYFKWFDQFIRQGIEEGIKFVPLITLYHQLIDTKTTIRPLLLTQDIIDGRSGLLAQHKKI